MRFLAFHAGIYVRLRFSTDVLIFCDYPRLSTFLSLLFRISVKAQLNWKLSPRSYENKTKSIWPGVKFSCLQLSLFLHHLSPYSLLPFHFISNLRGLPLPCFFLLTTCLFTNVLAICLFPLYPLLVSFPSPCIVQPMRWAARHAAGTWTEFWNKHDLLTYKEEPRAIPQLENSHLIIKATREKKSRNSKGKSFWFSEKPQFAAKLGKDSRKVILLLGVLTWKDCELETMFSCYLLHLFRQREE